MLFIIFLVILAIGIVLIILDHDNMEWRWGVGLFTTIVGTAAVIISITILMHNHIGVDGYIKQMNIRHDMLVYQYENDIYDNDNDLGKRELIVGIQNWNEDLAYRREVQDNLWIGIYYPNIYNQFEFIELNKRSK